MGDWDRLARDLQQGRVAALGELYDFCAGEVYGTLQELTTCRTGAERLTVAVFVHVWQHPEVLTPDRPAGEQVVALAQRWGTAARHLARMPASLHRAGSLSSATGLE